MKSLIAEIISQRLGAITTDFPDAQYQNEASGILPTPVIQEFMTGYHYAFLRMITEAGLTINDLVDNITDNQVWDAFLANTKNISSKVAAGSSPLAPKIESGATRISSSMPDFLRADGSILAFDILGATTNLKLSTNNTPFVVDTDINTTGVTGAPATNNTAQIDDLAMSNDLYAGEDGTVIIIDNVGSEISSRIGQVAAFKTSTGEIFKALIKSATELVDAFRGYYFDNNGAPIVRGNLSDNDTITLMNIGWVFIENDGLTVDVAYTTPSISYTAPSAPSAGDYWFDITNKIWKKWGGASWDLSNNAMIGQIVSDDTDTLASRSADFSLPFKNYNNIELQITTAGVVKSKKGKVVCSVYGTDIVLDLLQLSWDITADLESPLSESADTLYYLYVSSNGQPIISTERPYDRPDLGGHYHPYHSYRCAGIVYNDSLSDFSLTDDVKYNSEITSRKIVISDQKPAGTDGGSSGAATYITRVLNTKEGSDEFGQVLLNQIHVIEGVYRVRAMAPSYAANFHRIKLSDITQSIDLALGMNAFTGTGGQADTKSFLDTIIKIDKQSKLELKNYTTTASITLGLGRAVSDGNVEVYAIVALEKIS